MFASLRYSAAALHAEARWKRWRRRRRASSSSAHCPICSGKVALLSNGEFPCETPLCADCGSVPRQRALVLVLRQRGLDNAVVHESSPSLCTLLFFRRNSRAFHASNYWPDRVLDRQIGVFRNVDLSQQPYQDGAFDLVVTQDVLEHVPVPERAIREIHRTLRPGGAHVFTVPRTPDQETRTRAELRDGNWHHLQPPEYHRNPIDPKGSLVVTDWGVDLERRIASAVPVECRDHLVHAPDAGIPEPIEVFVARNRT